VIPDRTDWLTRTLQVLEPPENSQYWPSAAGLRLRARRRWIRRRVAAAAAAAIIVAVGTAVPLQILSSGSRPDAGANSQFHVVARSGSAIELAADASGPAPPPGARAEHQVAVGETRFSLTLLRRLSEASPGTNVVASPSSLATALTMLQLGARGSTAGQISRALGTPGLTSAQQAAALRVLTASEKQAARQTGVQLESASGIWTQYGLPLRPVFMSALRTYFGAGVWQADFAHGPHAAAAALNAWAAARTHGRIARLLDPGAIGPGTQAVLANAAFLKASWAQPFDPARSTGGRFHLSAGGTALVPFMHVAGASSLLARAGPDFAAVQLPYHGQRFAALVMMPTAGSLPGFLRTLTPAGLGRAVGALRETSVDLALPRFQLRDDHELTGTLQSMGIRAAFRNANLTGLSPAGGLAVRTVEQRAFLSANEQGTVGAAATGVVIDGAARVPQLTLTIDRPFLFLVRDVVTGAILFGSAVQNPAAGG